MDIEKDLTAMAVSVDEFQRKVLDLPRTDGLLPPHRQKFRVAHMREEIDELVDAYSDGIAANVVDSLTDLIYIAIGALLEMGVPPLEAFEPVHQANMLKVRGITKRGEAYDALKPHDWKAPNHEAIIADMLLRKAISPAFLEATRICEERGARYNQGSVTRRDHFPFGNVGHAAICWLKMIRLRSDIEGNHADAAELSEHIRDLMNYLAFWWESLNGGIR